MNIKTLLEAIRTMDVNVKENTLSKTTGLDIIEITGKKYFNIDIEGKTVKVSYIVKTGEVVNQWIDDNGNVIQLCLPMIVDSELKLPSIENAKQIANELNDKIILNKVERDDENSPIKKSVVDIIAKAKEKDPELMNLMKKAHVKDREEMDRITESFEEDFERRHKIINSTTYGAIDNIDLETGKPVNDIIDELKHKLISGLTDETDESVKKFIGENINDPDDVNEFMREWNKKREGFDQMIEFYRCKLNDKIKEKSINRDIMSNLPYTCEAARFDLVDKVTMPKGEVDFMVDSYSKLNEEEKPDYVNIGGKSYKINRDFPNIELDEDDDEYYDEIYFYDEDGKEMERIKDSKAEKLASIRKGYSHVGEKLYNRNMENIEKEYGINLEEEYKSACELVEANDIDEIETINNIEGDVEIMNNPFVEYEERERAIEEKRESLERLYDENETTQIVECKVGEKVVELEEGLNCHIIDFNIFNSLFIINIGLTPVETHIRSNMDSFLDVEIEFLYEELGEVENDVMVPVKDIGTFKMSVRNILEEGLGAWYSFEDGDFRLTPLELRGLTTLFRM